MSVSDVSAKAVANLGWTDIRLPHPVFHGDTLYAESEVIELRDSEKRPTQGIVTIRTTGLNQHGTIICTYLRTMLVWKRGHGPDAL
jgi:itaconyl-CoA hydratase